MASVFHWLSAIACTLVAVTAVERPICVPKIVPLSVIRREAPLPDESSKKNSGIVEVGHARGKTATLTNSSSTGVASFLRM
jgi:hypothetical protein